MSMLVVGVSIVIFSILVNYLKSAIATNLKDSSGNLVLDMNQAGMLLGVVLLIAAWFLKKKFKAGILGDMMLGMGATGIAIAVSGIIDYAKGKMSTSNQSK